MTTSDTPAPSRAIAEQIIDGLTWAGPPALSPDGEWVAFAVTRIVLADNEYHTNVWVAPTDGSSAGAPVSSGPHDDAPAWSPDGSLLAFTRRAEDGDGHRRPRTTVVVMPFRRAGEVRTVADLPERVTDLAWSPDGTMLGFTSRTPDPRYDHPDERWQAPRRIDTYFTRLDDEGWVNDRPRHVYVVPADGTAPVRNLTPGPWQHRGLTWLPDSSALVTSGVRHDGWDRDLAEDLYVVPLHGEPRALTGRTGVYHSPAAAPDGRLIAFIGHDDPLTDPQNDKVGVIGLDGGAHRWISEGLDRTFNPTGVSVTIRWDGPGRLLALAEDRGRCHVVRLSVDGSEPTWATEGDGTVKGFDLAGGSLAFSAADVVRPAEVFVQRDGRELRLSTVTDRYAAVARPCGWERFGVPTTDDTAEIDAWIMRPRGFDPQRRYPVLLNVHGGPHTQYGETYFDEAQLQAAAGFVVLMSNPRGSSGREQRWGQAILGPRHPVAPGTGWGGVDVDDVMAVLDAALRRYPFCDPARVGMLGGSYGGWMATELAGRFGERFRAICSERAVNNLLTEEWSSDIGTVFRVEHGVDPISDPDEYWRMSPVRRAADIHVPMLLLHSEDDLRCPINQAEELFVVLRWLGRDVTFYRFPGEGHELSRSGSPVHRVQRAEIILDWFTERLAPTP